MSGLIGLFSIRQYNRGGGKGKQKERGGQEEEGRGQR